MSNSRNALLFKAGPAAFQDIRNRGFAAERVGTIAGASGGAKWLVLSQIDRVIVDDILPTIAGPLHLIGSSIGAWRFACYAQDRPLAAIERFEQAYLEQSYSDKPNVAEITAKSQEILDYLLGPDGAQQIVDSARCRLHIMTVRCGRLTSSDWRPLLATGLIAAAASNLFSRRSLGLFFSRALFFDARDLPPFYNASGFPLERVPLQAANLPQAVMASGAIPMVLAGVRDIAGAPPGTYRDGGVIDYHLDLPLSDPDRLTLYPHFFDQLTPGWFDKKLAYRRHGQESLDRTILVCPSPDFIASLPHGKVPDRHDFVNFPPEERERNWRKTVSECQRLADEFHDVLVNDKLAERLEPL